MSVMPPDQLDEFRKTEFPVLQKILHLNHAGIAPVMTSAMLAAAHFAAEATRTAQQNYAQWEARIEKIRGLAAWFMGAQLEEVAFVRNTSHGLSLVAEGLDWREGDNIVTTAVEYPSNVYPWLNLKHRGVSTKLVPARDGEFRTEDLIAAIDSRTRLVSVSHVEFSTGFRFDLGMLADAVHAKGALLCVDAIQSLGVHPVDVVRMGIDFLAADGHKWLCSFEGTGVFYVKKNLIGQLRPPLVGWNSVVKNKDFDTYEFDLPAHARRFEEGSLPQLTIFPLGAALEKLAEIGIDRIERMALANAALVREAVRRRGWKVVNFRGTGLDVAITCFTGDFDGSSVVKKLKQSGSDLAFRRGAVRVSPHFYNTADDISRFFDLMDGVVKGG